jgi:hypothetical protein
MSRTQTNRVTIQALGTYIALNTCEVISIALNGENVIITSDIPSRDNIVLSYEEMMEAAEDFIKNKRINQEGSE